MNSKVKRLLDAMAVVMKDQDPKVIEQLHKVINDKRDGYNFDFTKACNSYKCFVKG